MTTRQAVVAEAELWLGTPWHHNARVCGAGVDCANLPLACYHAAGLIPELRPHYDQQWHLHRDEERFLDVVRQHAREIEADAAGLGDLLVWKFGRTFSHGGIVSGAGEAIHAWINAGVIRTRWREHSDLNNRPIKAFTLWSDDA